MGLFKQNDLNVNCIYCGTPMSRVDIEGLENINVCVPAILLPKKTRVETYACPKCGNIGFFAQDPSIIKK